MGIALEHMLLFDLVNDGRNRPRKLPRSSV